MPTDEWMRRRQEDADNSESDYARGLEAVAVSMRAGGNLRAPTTGAVRAVGAGLRTRGTTSNSAQPIRRGEKAVLGDDAVVGILFNEMRSFSGPQAPEAYLHIAHTIMNGDEIWGSDRSRYARTASPVAKPPKAEEQAYRAMAAAVAKARAQRIDPTGGALHFRFTTTPTRDPFVNRPLRTQFPVHNSFTMGDVPSSSAYVNTY